MGNCCKAASSMEWAGDDWGSLTSKHKTTSSSSRRSSSKVVDEGECCSWDDVVLEKKQLLGALLTEASSDTNGKVKIRISKKELEELMKKKQEGMRVSAEQVLVGLLNARDHHALLHHRPWRPVLQSIPEIN